MEQSRINQSFALDSATAHTILDSALDAHVLMSQTGTIVAWNPQSERIFGWTAQEVLGRCLSEVIIPPAFREAHERAIRTFESTGQGTVLGKRIEVDGWHRDQRQFSIELTVTSVKTQSGQVFSAFVRDIMERKQAEKFLKEAKERAEQAARDRAAILAAVDVFFIYVDCHGLVTEWTARAEQTFGLFRAIVLGRRLPDLPIPWNWDEVVGMMQGGGDRKKVRLRQGDGTNGSSGRRSPLSSRGRGPAGYSWAKTLPNKSNWSMTSRSPRSLNPSASSPRVSHLRSILRRSSSATTPCFSMSHSSMCYTCCGSQALLAAVQAGACSPALIDACVAANEQADFTYLLSEILRRSFNRSTASLGWGALCRR